MKSMVVGMGIKMNLGASLTPQEWEVSEVSSHPRHSQGTGAPPTRKGLLNGKINTIFFIKFIFLSCDIWWVFGRYLLGIMGNKIKNIMLGI
jgi:hypothetical protein